MAESAVSLLIEYLGHLLGDDVQLLKGVHGEVRKLRDELESMRSFLRNADARQDTDQGISAWVKQVREAAFDIEGLLDDYMLCLVEQQQEDDAQGFLGFLPKAVRSMKQLKARHQIANEIQDARTRLQEISRRKDDYNLQRVEQGSSSNSLNNYGPRFDALFTEESELVGIDGPKKQLTDWLLREEPRLSTISVVGMGGLGKTTLVKKVYEQVKTEFDTYAWITVSQTFKAKDLVQRMATEFYEAKQPQAYPSRLDALTDVEQLIQMLRDYLQNQRYVLVLDDVWSTDAWKFMCNALPAAQEYGSRVIITTRDNDVASFCHVGTSRLIHNLEPLGQENAWSLFCRKAFPFDERNTCPPHLKELSESFVRKCRGLPLAIVTLAGLLSIKEQSYDEWDMIARSLRTELEDNYDLKSMNRIIMLSYNELPYHLKSCFLYLSIFPEDYHIKRMKLIRLWIAEGFVGQKDSQTSPEEVAESYLNTLVSRSLIQVARRKPYGKAISYQVHDLVRDIIISKFSEEQLFVSLPSQNTTSADSIRRLSVYNNIKNAPEYESFSRLRSLFFFWVRKPSIASVILPFSGLRLLRVVDLESVSMESFPDDLTNLYYLRYLSLENSKIKSIPNTVGKLKELETLNLKGTLVRELPVEILKLQHLRHLMVYSYVLGISSYNIDGIKVPARIGNLTSLQKLAYVEAAEGEIVRELGNLTQLRRLGVIKLRRVDGCDFCTSVEKMNHLQALNVVSMDEDEVLDLQSLSHPRLKTTLQRLYLKGRLQKLPQWIASLQNLVDLCLQCSRLKDNPLKTLQSLPNLVELRLEQAYDGEELCCEAGGYPRLKVLDLDDLKGLKQVRVEKGALSCLEELYISKCKELLERPLWLKHLTNIKELRLWYLQESFMRSLYKEGLHEEGVRAAFIRHIPHIYDTRRRRFNSLARPSGEPALMTDDVVYAVLAS